LSTYEYSKPLNIALLTIRGQPLRTDLVTVGSISTNCGFTAELSMVVSHLLLFLSNTVINRMSPKCKTIDKNDSFNFIYSLVYGAAEGFIHDTHRQITKES